MIDDRNPRNAERNDLLRPIADLVADPLTVVGLQAELARVRAFADRTVLALSVCRANEQAALRHVAALENLLAYHGDRDLLQAAAELYGDPP